MKQFIMLTRLCQIAWVSALFAGCALNSTFPAPVADGASTPPAKSERTSTPSYDAKTQHLVERGDTLFALSKKYNIPLKQLAAYNQLTEPYVLQTGQILQLTDVRSKAATGKVEALPTPVEKPEVVVGKITQPGFDAQPQVTINESDKNRKPESANRPQAPSSNDSAPDADYEKIQDNAVKWQMPMKGKVTSAYDNQINKGINMSGSAGQAILAAAPGKVIYSGADVRNTGKLVIIKHNSNLLSVYAHQGSNLVSEGTMIRSGDKVATLSEAANIPPVLHFEIRYKGKPIDPAKVMP